MIKEAQGKFSLDIKITKVI